MKIVKVSDIARLDDATERFGRPRMDSTKNLGKGSAVTDTTGTIRRRRVRRLEDLADAKSQNSPSDPSNLELEDMAKSKFETCMKDYKDWPARVTPYGTSVSFLIYFPSIQKEANFILQNATPEQLNQLFTLKIFGLEKGINYEVQY